MTSNVCQTTWSDRYKHGIACYKTCLSKDIKYITVFIKKKNFFSNFDDFRNQGTGDGRWLNCADLSFTLSQLFVIDVSERNGGKDGRGSVLVWCEYCLIVYRVPDQEDMFDQRLWKYCPKALISPYSDDRICIAHFPHKMRCTGDQGQWCDVVTIE